ncbi:MAG TPA: NUDIX hydrolase [Candidatus Acidoferrales bacterium]|nr:NUDIX hydrolase [Candidatus Acidoferrales bacterium]
MNDDRPATIESTRAFEGRVFTVRIDRVRYSDGAEHRVDVVEHGPSVAIVATPSHRQLVLVRQYRQAAGTALWELPAGAANPGEDALEGAARELREETGFRAARLQCIGSLFATPGFCDEEMHFVHASELSEGATEFDEDERIETGVFTLERAWRLVAEGAVRDMKTVLALYWMEGVRGELRSEFGR